MRLEAITGFLAVIVLLIVLNWFVHKVYWSGWIAKHNRRRQAVLGGAGAGVLIGLLALGFTSVYREGFETVSLPPEPAGSRSAPRDRPPGGGDRPRPDRRSPAPSSSSSTASCPYKKMLIATGIMIGVVLVVMVGGTAATFQDLGWLPTHELPAGIIPAWMGAWFEVYPTWESDRRPAARRRLRHRQLLRRRVPERAPPGQARRAGRGQGGGAAPRRPADSTT